MWRSCFSDETGQAAGYRRRRGQGHAAIWRDAPFFVVNSDSIWIENGGTSALTAMMMAKWDERRMDGLLLLADIATAYRL